MIRDGPIGVLVRKTPDLFVCAEIVRRQVSEDVVGYLDHPSGKFSVETFYPFKARIRDGREPEERCVACVVRLTLQAGDAPIEIKGERGRLLLKPTATIDIRNMTPTPTGGMTNMHFHHYNSLFGPGCGLRAVPIETDVPCPAAKENKKVNGAECSNSHIP